MLSFRAHCKSLSLIELYPVVSSTQSSRDLLLDFSRSFLAGIGDVTKHLGYMGYSVVQAQTSLDEFDYGVSNLAVDLRCGIRLALVDAHLVKRKMFSLSRTIVKKFGQIRSH